MLRLGREGVIEVPKSPIGGCGLDTDEAITSRPPDPLTHFGPPHFSVQIDASGWIDSKFRGMFIVLSRILLRFQKTSYSS